MKIDSSKFNKLYKTCKTHNFKDAVKQDLLTGFVKDMAKQNGISEADMSKFSDVTKMSFDVEKRLGESSTSKETLFNQIYSKCNDKIEKMKTKEELKKQGITNDVPDSSIASLASDEMKSLITKIKQKGLKFDCKSIDMKSLSGDTEQLKKEFFRQTLKQGYTEQELHVSAGAVMKDAPTSINLFEHSVNGLQEFFKLIEKIKSSGKKVPSGKFTYQDLNQLADQDKKPAQKTSPAHNKAVHGLNSNENSLLGEGGTDYESDGLQKKEPDLTDINRKGVANAFVDAKNGKTGQTELNKKVDTMLPGKKQNDREKELAETLGVNPGEMSLAEMEQLYEQLMMSGQLGPTKHDD